jgi:ATP-dependent DNA ligase
VVIDGEVMGSTWNDTMHYVKKDDLSEMERQASLSYYIFDALTLEEWNKGVCELPPAVRKERIEESYHDRIHKVPHSLINASQIDEYYHYALQEGYEGVMLKAANGHYVRDRSSMWLKYKPFVSIDCPIVDIHEGTGKYAGVAASVSIRRNLTFGGSKVVRVGVTGNMAFRRELLEQRENLIGMVGEVKVQKGRENAAEFGTFLRVRSDKLL